VSINGRDIIDLLQKNLLDYSMISLVRALPDVRDGLKPAQRRILWAMMELGLKPGGKPVKSARIVGDVMGKWHPHGDQSVYSTMVRMAQDWQVREPMVIGQGNFGSNDPDAPASMRYTEATLSKYSLYLLEDTDNQYVDFIPNFDGSLKEPTVLGAMVPNLIINGTEGIAVGMATRMYPHNIQEVITAAVWHIHNMDGLASLSDEKQRVSEAVNGYMMFMRGPDFPTGGEVYGDFRKIFETGRGSFHVRAKIRTEKNRVIITELPYNLTKEKLFGQLEKLAEEKNSGIADYSDESSDTLRIVIEVKRGDEPQVVRNQILKRTSLDQTYSYLNLVLDGGIPIEVSLYHLFQRWIEHRMSVVQRRVEFELEKKTYDYNIKVGLMKALPIIDTIIEKVKVCTTDKELIYSLVEMGFSETQAKAVMQMSLKRLARFEVDELEEKVKELSVDIKALSITVSDDKKILRLIVDEINNMRDVFTSSRRSSLIKKPVDVEKSDMVKDRDIIISLTSDGIKKDYLSSWRKKKTQGKGLVDMVQCSSHDTILFFTDDRAHRVKAWDIPLSEKGKGTPFHEILKVCGEEIFRKVMAIEEFDDRKVYFFLRSGKVKAIKLSSLNSNRASTKMLTIRYGDFLIDADLSYGFGRFPGDDTRIIHVDEIARYVSYPIGDIRPTNRDGVGVRGIKVDTECRGASVVSEREEVLMVSTTGWGRKCPIEEISDRNRGLVGKVLEIVPQAQKKKLIGVWGIGPDDEVYLFKEDGSVVLKKAEEIKRGGQKLVDGKILYVYIAKKKVQGLTIY